jgi:hypothetical protein
MKWRIYDEDYERFYGYASFKGKVLLDIGADYGSTAMFFLRKGARKVIAVEGDRILYKRLLNTAERYCNIMPVFLYISKKQDFEKLILIYRPAIMKVDCEGCESHLLKINSQIFSDVEEYIIEAHGQKLIEETKNKLISNNYAISHIDKWAGDKGTIIYAVRREENVNQLLKNMSANPQAHNQEAL